MPTIHRAVFIGAICVVFSCSAAFASLTIDLRFHDSPDYPKILWGLPTPGQIIPIDIYVIVTGKKTGFDRTPVIDESGDQAGWNYRYDYADGFQSLRGSIIADNSSFGLLVPDGTSGIFPHGYNGLVSATGQFAGKWSTRGESIDLNGDGVRDLGAPNGAGSDQADKYINIRADRMVYTTDTTIDIINAPPPYQRPDDTPSRELLVGKVGLYVGTPRTSHTWFTTINWALRREATGEIEADAAIWQEDRFPEGATRESDPLDATTGTLWVGAPLGLVWEPPIDPKPAEPAHLALGLAAAAFLAFRPRRRTTGN